MKSALKKLKNDDPTLGSFLKSVRKQKNLTQRYVASQLNLTPQFLSSIELSKCAPPPPVLRKMVFYYQIHPKKIIHILLEDEQQRLKRLFSLK